MEENDNFKSTLHLYTNLLTDGFFAEALAIPWISMTLGSPGATALFQENNTSFKLLTFQFYLKKIISWLRNSEKQTQKQKHCHPTLSYCPG